MMIEYTLIRSRRRTISIEISRDARVIVRAPLGTSQHRIDAFVNEKAEWISCHLAAQKKRCLAHPEPDETCWKEWLLKAKKVIPMYVSHYSAIMHVKPTAIHYSRAKTRFGSCSGNNSITFSLRLMDYPPEAIEYVVVHELAHIKYKNHSKDFYNYVSSVLPDYRHREKLLKE